MHVSKVIHHGQPNHPPNVGVRQESWGNINVKIDTSPTRSIHALRGIAKMMYQLLGGGAWHLRDERQSWTEKSV